MGLMDWYAGNIRKASAARQQGRMDAIAQQRAAGADQAQSLMGYNTMATGQDGLTTGMSSGLMANPDDPMSHIQMGMGLMQIPGYESAANQFLGQAIGNQLGRQQQIADYQQQERYNQAQLAMQQLKLQGGMDKDRANMENTLRDDATAAMKPYRTAIEQYNDVNNLIGDSGGFSGMNNASDIALMKGYAKILLPNEAVMTDDMEKIAMAEGIDPVLRGLASKINMGHDLSVQERHQIHEAMNSLMKGKLQQYGQAREDFTNRAASYRLDPANILRTAISSDLRSFGATPDTSGGATPEEAAQIRKEAGEQQGYFGRLGDAIMGN